MKALPSQRAARTIVLVVVALAIAGALGATALGTSTGIGTFVSSSSADYQATQAHARQFGSDPVVVLVREPLGTLLSPSVLETVSRLEACLGGQQLRLSSTRGALVPVAGGVAKPYGGAAGPCGRLMAARTAKVVYGPGTFLNRAVVAVGQQVSSLTSASAAIVNRAQRAARRLARARGLDAAGIAAAGQAAGKLALAQQIGRLGKVAQRAELTGAPSITDTAFLRKIVFGSSGASGSADRPSARFSYLFPTADTALIQVRLRAELSDRQQSQAIRWIREAVAMKRFRLPGGSYTVTGEPVVLHDLAGQLSSQVLLLLVAAVVLMGLVLLGVFRRRPRLLPLAIALAAVAITLGLSALTGASLTLASIAVMPVLVGLGVDYGVQLQSGTSPRSIAAAALATAMGFLLLLLSPVPMVRSFGLLLVVGVAIALVCALAVVPAARTLLAAGVTCRRVRRSAFPGFALLGGAPQRAAAVLTDAVLGAGELLAAPVRRLARHGPSRQTSTGSADRLAAIVRALTLHSGRVLVIATVLALAGWALDTQIGVQSDLTKLVPQSMPALQHLRALERTTGVSGEIDVLVNGSDVATPQAIRWMVAYEAQVVAHFGYSASGSCRTSRLCPALSLPDLFPTAGRNLTAPSIDSFLASVPSYFSGAVITPDRSYASLAFGIRLMPLSEQRRVISYLREHLHPPVGVRASLSGLPVLAADADGALSSPGRRLLTVLAALVAVGLTLLLVFRDLRRVLVPFVPIVLASGWSALILYMIQVPLNPMSATLGVLVIAVATEFSVVIAERVRQERHAAIAREAKVRETAGGPRVPRGGSALLATGQLRHAVERAYRSTGAAVLASAITAIAGFGVLVLSNVAMLRQFGWVTVVDLASTLVGVLFVLPAVLAVADRFPSAAAGSPATNAPKSLETVA